MDKYRQCFWCNGLGVLKLIFTNECQKAYDCRKCEGKGILLNKKALNRYSYHEGMNTFVLGETNNDN